MASPISDFSDFSLLQGARLAQKKIALNKNDPNYLLQNTSDPVLGSIVEGLDDPNSILSRPLPGAGSSPMNSPTDEPSSEKPLFNIPAYKPAHQDNPISGLHDEFNNLLTQYTTQYKLMMDELMINNNRPELRNFAGKNVKHDNNNFYHINNFGFSHKYDNKAWKNRSVSCSTEPVDISSDEFDTFLPVENMGSGQSCNVAGFNIHNKKSGEQSWVDIKGVRHIYPEEMGDERNASCQGTPKSLSDTEYNTIPEGTKMDSNTQCNKLNVDPKIIENLAKLNIRLQALGNQLLSHTTSMVGSDEHIQDEITNVHNSMVATLKRLEGHKQQFNNTKINLGNTGVQLNREALNTNIQGSKRSSELFLRMNYMKYVVGLIFVILLVLFSFISFPSSKQSTMSSIILILVILVVLFHFWTFISKKLF